MAFTVEYNSLENIIFVNLEGKVGKVDVQGSFEEVFRLVRHENCLRVLTDLRKAVVDVSQEEIFLIPEYMAETSEKHGVLIHSVRRAIVASKNLKMLSFYETVSLNRWHATKLFEDVEEAKGWLKD